MTDGTHGIDGAGGNDERVPRLPRSRKFKLTTQQLVRIAMTALLLALILGVRRPCSDTVSKFVTSFGEQGSGSGATAMPKPGNVEAPSGLGSAGDYVQLRPDMSEAEIKAAIERAKAKAAERGGSGGGSAAEGGAGSADAGSGSGVTAP